MKKVLLSACFLCTGLLVANAQFVKNDFMDGLSVGEIIEKHTFVEADTTTATRNPHLGQWNLTLKTSDQGGAADVAPKAVAPLTYDGYIDSGKGNAMAILKVSATRTSGYSIVEDITYNEGAFYTAFLLKPTLVGSGNTGNGQDFLAIDGQYYINNQRARVFIRRGATHSGSNPTFTLGLFESDKGATYTWGASEFPTGSTVLVVLKYDFAGEKVSLFVNPDLSKAEGDNTVFASYDIADGVKSIKSIAIKQRTSNEVELGSIRFTDTWEGVGNDSTSSIGDDATADKGNIVSVKYYTIGGLSITQPLDNGITIVKNIYENGDVETIKLMK